MSWLKKIPWLSLLLLLLTYSVFGWLVSQSTPNWAKYLIEMGLSLPQFTAEKIIWLGEGLLILLMVIILMAPLQLVRFCFGSWLQSDTKALISVLAWAIAAVLITTQIEHFVRLLVLVSSTLLAHLELQKAGYQEWQILMVLAFICLAGFMLGSLSFAEGVGYFS